MRISSDFLKNENFNPFCSFSEKIFGDSTPAPSAQELTKRRELAHERLESLKSGTGETLNYLQSPILNKQLIYCLLDIIIAELFPEIIDEKDAKDLK